MFLSLVTALVAHDSAMVYQAQFLRLFPVPLFPVRLFLVLDKYYPVSTAKNIAIACSVGLADSRKEYSHQID
jgi:hypothetical protein